MPITLTFAAVLAGCGLAVASLFFKIRGGKWLTRFGPMAALAFAAAGGLLALDAAGAAAASSALACMLAVTAAYRRRGPDRSPCTTCPERGRSACSGFAPILRRERALQRATRPWFHSAGEPSAT